MLRFRVLLLVLSLLGAIGVSISSTAQPRNGRGPKACNRPLEQAELPWLINKTTRDVYHLRSGEFFVTGHILRGGLSLDLKTRDLKTGERTTVLKGKEQFAKIMQYFKGRFNFISGVWFEGDNIATFNQLTGEGMSIEEAALKTWTGQQAEAAGYTQPKVYRLVGKRGRYIIVEIDFYKENSL